MRRIIHVLWSLEVAGAEKLALEMIHALPPDRFHAVICSVAHDGLLGEQLREDGYNVYHRPKKAGFDWEAVKWLRQIMELERIDVVHAHQYSPMVYAALATLGKPKVTVIYTEHGRNHPEERRWKRRIVNPLLGRLVDHIVSVSENTRKAMTIYDRLPHKRIKVVRNGIDLSKARSVADLREKCHALEIPDGYDVIGTAARLEEVKNLPMMLRVFKRVTVNRPKTLLLIAGIGILGDAMKALAQELGIEKSVRFIGLRHDLQDIYRILSVFLLTSFTEGISITLLEAMANGVPAVVTDVGGNPEVVIDGETGYLVPLGNDKMMAEKILDLLEHRDKSTAMAAKSMEWVRDNFSFDLMMKSYLDLYENN